LWPGEDPVGKTLAISEWTFLPAGRIPGGRAGAEGTTVFRKSDWAALPEVYRECQVIGVARDITSRIADADHQQIYLPFSSEISPAAVVLVRLARDTAGALAQIVQAAEAAGLVLQFNRRVSAYFADDMLPYSGLAVLSGALGGLALLMASVGLYGVMAFTVNQRVREIGIRVALGATAEKVVALFVRQGMRLVVMGLALGLGGGALFALLLAKILYGLGGAFDPVAFGGVVAIFASIALLACWLPARRAAKVDPMLALRAE
jgi:ABC-type antimicrobial peptide transport system permease subunit